MIERLGEHAELADVLDAGRRLVDLRDDALDESQDVFLLREIAVGGVRDPLGPGPLADRVLLDADQRGEIGALVADDDGLADEGRGLEGVLEFRRRDVLAARRDDDVLDAVDDLQVGAVYPLPDVAGVQPAFCVDRLRGRVGLAPVTREGAGMPGEDLSRAVSEDDLYSGMGLADGPELDAPAAIARRDGAVLRHAVELVDDDAHGEEEEEHVGRDGSGCRSRRAHPAQAEPLAQGAVEEDIADGIADATPQRVLAAVGEHRLGDAVADLHPDAVVQLLDA